MNRLKKRDAAFVDFLVSYIQYLEAIHDFHRYLNAYCFGTFWPPIADEQRLNMCVLRPEFARIENERAQNMAEYLLTTVNCSIDDFLAHVQDMFVPYSRAVVGEEMRKGIKGYLRAYDIPLVAKVNQSGDVSFSLVAVS